MDNSEASNSKGKLENVEVVLLSHRESWESLPIF